MTGIPPRSLNPRGRITRQAFKAGTAPRAQIVRMIKGQPDVATWARQFMAQRRAASHIVRAPAK